jgi:hypothetical protein
LRFCLAFVRPDLSKIPLIFPDSWEFSSRDRFETHWVVSHFIQLQLRLFRAARQSTARSLARHLIVAPLRHRQRTDPQTADRSRYCGGRRANPRTPNLLSPFGN